MDARSTNPTERDDVCLATPQSLGHLNFVNRVLPAQADPRDGLDSMRYVRTGPPGFDYAGTSVEYAQREGMTFRVEEAREAQASR